jgi:hypothetical protein
MGREIVALPDNQHVRAFVTEEFMDPLKKEVLMEIYDLDLSEVLLFVQR